VEFTLHMNGAARLVALEQVGKMHPDLSCSWAFELQTHVHEILRKSGVKPIINEKIFFGPLNISGMSGVVEDVRQEIETHENNCEEHAPLGIVVRL
jgi:hypothetical protein